MPIQVSDRIEQQNRGTRLDDDNFYYTMNGSDIDFSVNAIIEDVNDTVGLVVALDVKYIIRNASSTPIATPGVDVANNDIIAYNGSNWVLHKRVSNAETSFGIVYDKRTKLVYQYDAIALAWLPLLQKNGTIDGGTF
jgi:hypothetical protein